MTKTDKTKIKFSFHALNRADECGVSCAELVKAWFRSTEYTLSKGEQAYKFQTYGLESLDDIYTYDTKSQLIFTVHRDSNRSNIIITVTKRGLKL